MKKFLKIFILAFIITFFVTLIVMSVYLGIIGFVIWDFNIVYNVMISSLIYRLTIIFSFFMALIFSSAKSGEHSDV